MKLNRREFLSRGTQSVASLLLSTFFFKKWAWAQALGADKWASLRQALGGTDGQLLLPADDEFSTFKKVFNLRLKSDPTAIVRCGSADSVSKSVLWAAQNQVPIRMRSGGHSYEGFSTGDGIVLDTRPANFVNISTADKTAKIGAGGQLQNVIRKLGAAGFAIPTGSCPTVGVSGLTQGGGMGLSGRKWGLTCDNLRSAQVVLADGSVVTASDAENPDLFWAIKGGGGGNFGVVTEFEFNLHRALDVYTFAIKWDSAHAADVISLWQSYMPTAAPEITSILKLTGSGGAVSVICVGQILSRDGVNPPTQNQAEALLQPLTAIRPASFNMRPRTFLDAAEYFSGGDDPPVRFKAKSNYSYDPILADGRRELVSQLQNIGHGVAIATIFDSYGGQIKAATPSAFAHREALNSVQYYCQWNTDLGEAANVQAMRTLHQAMAPYFSKYAYVNYCDLDVTNWEEAYFGDNFDRLMELKRRYDPTGIFNFGPQSLASRL